ncbi:MAG: two-component regulator propeller domain-containing protein [Chitinophagales bacterium]
MKYEKNVQHFFFAFCLCFFSFFSKAQHNITQVFNTENSALTNNTVRALAVDENGAKWIGTDNGLLKHENDSWTIFQTASSPIPDNQIRAISIDSANNIWIGTFLAGIMRFDSENWTFFNTSNSDLPENQITDITFDDNENVWIATTGGLAKLDNTENISVFNGNIMPNVWLLNVSAIAIDAQQLLWVAPVNSGLLSLNIENNEFTNYQLTNSNVPDNTMLDIATDSNNTKWLTTAADGIGNFDDVVFTNFDANATNLNSNSTTKIAVNQQNLVLVGTTNAGLNIYNKNANTWQQLTTENSSLPDNHILSLAFENDSLAYIGTFAGGFCQLELDLTTAINDNISPNNALQYKLNAFPNPAKNTIHISDIEQLPKSVFMYDNTGKRYVSESFEASWPQLDVSHLEVGIYYLHILSQKNERKSTKIAIFR